MVNLFVIYGCHGAGKSTLARNIINSDGGGFTEHANEFGTYTKSKNGNIVAAGKYSTNCGGLDSLKSTNHYYMMIKWLTENFPQSTIIAEGIFMSALFKKPLDEFLKLKYEKGINVNQVFLYADTQTSFNRVLSRSGRTPKLDNIKSKVNAVKNNIKKFLELGEFKSIVIDTVGKDEKEVYDRFEYFYKEVLKNGK